MILLTLEVSVGINPYTTVGKKFSLNLKNFKRPQSLLREARIQTE